MCHCQSVKQLGVYQANEGTSDIWLHRGKDWLFMMIWNLNCFDFLRFSKCSIVWCLQRAGSFHIVANDAIFFRLSRSVWIVIENNYPVLCFDNAHHLHQLNHVRHYLQYPFTEAPNQPEPLHKFPFTAVWILELIQINMSTCPSHGGDIQSGCRAV